MWKNEKSLGRKKGKTKRCWAQIWQHPGNLSIFWKDCYEARIQSRETRLTENVNAPSAVSFSLPLTPPSLCSLSFWSVYPWSVCERRGGWQVAVCERYWGLWNIYQSNNDSLDRVSGGRRRGGGEKSKKREWRVPVFFFVRSKDEKRWKKQNWDFQTLVVLWMKYKDK